MGVRGRSAVYDDARCEPERSATSLESDRDDDDRWPVFSLISLLCRNRENSDFMPCGRSLREAGIDQMQMTVWMRLSGCVRR